MRHTLTALLSAASICAFAGVVPAAAQTAPLHGYGNGPWPYGVDSTYAGAYPTVPSHTGAPLYSYHNTAPVPAPVGECQVISGNRVCFAGPTWAYGYGYGAWGGPIAAAVAAPVAAAGALVSAPVEGTAALAGARPPAPGGQCNMIAGNRVCTANAIP